MPWLSILDSSFFIFVISHGGYEATPLHAARVPLLVHRSIPCQRGRQICRCHSLCLMYMFLLRSAATSCYLWSSPILSGCSSRCPWKKLQLSIFHPREALLVGHWVTTLPLSSCDVLFFSTLTEVVLHRIGLVHLSHI